MKEFEGARLKAARVYRGMTIADLAENLGLQRQTISMYESGQIKMPEHTTVQKMSETLDFPVEYFFEPERDEVQTGSVYFRSLLTTNKKYRNEQVQKMEVLSCIFKFLSEYVEFHKLILPNFDTDNPEMAAAELRKFWNLGDGPVDNIVYHVEQHGIIVTSFETMTNDVDAFSQMALVDGETKYIIAYSKNKTSAARIHFDIAHELGHILLHEWSEDIEALSKEEFKDRENEAHQFASAFLLPREAFIKDLSVYPASISHYADLKKKWKVSMSAMMRRAYNLNVIDYNAYQRLMRNMQKEGIMRQEPLDNILFTAEPTLLKTAVQMLLDNNVFTAEEFIQELSNSTGLFLYAKEIEYLLDLPKDTLATSNIIPFHSLKLKSMYGK